MYETDIIAQKFFKKVTQKVLLENLRIVLIIRKRTHLGKVRLSPALVARPYCNQNFSLPWIIDETAAEFR